MKKIIYIVIAIIILGVGYYTISPLFRNVEVQDELPVALPSNTEDAADARIVESGFEDLSDEDKAAMTTQMEEANKEEPKVMKETTPEEPQTIISEPFPITSTLGHPAEGQVRVIDTGTEQIIRFENFQTINGPRLHLYLSKDLEGNDFIDLGPIRGTQGNINYTVPEGVDLSEYKYALHWCVPFKVLFNYAPLN